MSDLSITRQSATDEKNELNEISSSFRSLKGHKSMKHNARKGPDLSALSAKGQQQIAQAEKEGFLTTKGLQPPVATAWRRMCEQLKRPYMRVRLSGTRFAAIYLDLEPAGQQFPQETQDRLYHLGKLATEDFVAVNKDHLFVCKVPKEKVDWVIEFIRFVSKLDGQSQWWERR